MTTGHDVIVVGGGAIGAACARELARSGRSVAFMDPDIDDGPAWRAAAGMLAPEVETQGDRRPDRRARRRGPGPSRRPCGAAEGVHRRGHRDVAGGDRARGLRRGRRDEAPGAGGTPAPAVAPRGLARRGGGEGPLALAGSGARRALGAGRRRGGSPATGAGAAGGRRAARRHAHPRPGGRHRAPWRPGRGGAREGPPSGGRRGHRGRAPGRACSRGCPGRWRWRRCAGEMAALPAPEGVGRAIVYGKGAYLVGRDDEVTVGSTMDYAGFRNEVTAAGLARIFAGASQICPALARAPVTRTWSGLRPVSADGLPAPGRRPLARRALVRHGTRPERHSPLRHHGRAHPAADRRRAHGHRGSQRLRSRQVLAVVRAAGRLGAPPAGGGGRAPWPRSPPSLAAERRVVRRVARPPPPPVPLAAVAMQRLDGRGHPRPRHGGHPPSRVRAERGDRAERGGHLHGADGKSRPLPRGRPVAISPWTLQVLGTGSGSAC